MDLKADMCIISAFFLLYKEVTEMEIKLMNGYKLPMLGLGVYRLSDEDMMEQAVIAALQAGYRLFDTAQMYQNEALLGKALKKRMFKEMR